MRRTLAAALLPAVLCACGGGGGHDGAPPPPPPTPPFLAGPVTLTAPMDWVDGAALGYVDGDAVPDLVLEGSGASLSGDLLPMLGSTDGTFAPQAPVETLSPEYAVPVLGRFNADPDTDFVALGNPGMTVFLGNGHGQFGPATKGNATQSLQAGELRGAQANGDNLDDLAYSHDDTAGWLLADGAGGFALGGTISSVGSTVADFRVADVNDDGHDDIVAILTNGHLLVGLGDGTGSWLGLIDKDTGGAYFGLRLLRSAATGHMDVFLLPLAGAPRLDYCSGDGAGHFADPVAIPTPSDPAFQVVAGASALYVIGTDAADHGWKVWRLEGEFVPFPLFEDLKIDFLALNLTPQSGVATDLNLDGQEDLVLWGFTTSVHGQQIEVHAVILPLFGTGAAPDPTPLLRVATTP